MRTHVDTQSEESQVKKIYRPCPACNGNRRYTFAGKTVFCTVCQKGKTLKVMVKQ